MRWTDSITVVNGGGATADPIAAPTTVPAANCFRLDGRDRETGDFNDAVIVTLDAPAAETVYLELYMLDDRDDSGSGPPLAATDRWTRVGEPRGVQGGRIAAFAPFAGGRIPSLASPGSGGLCYLRVTSEGVSADRQVKVRATPASASVLALASTPVSSLDGAASLWPDAAATPTDPTDAYVASTRTFATGPRGVLLAHVTVATMATRAIGIEAQVQDSAGAWHTVARKIVITSALGTYSVEFNLPRYATVRLRARRWGGDATTDLSIIGDAYEALGTTELDGQPLELVHHQEDGIECFGDGAGGAVVMTVAPGITPEPAGAAAQQWIPTGNADTLVVDFAISVLACTTVEITVRERPVGSAVAVEQVAVNSVAAGVVAQSIAKEQVAGAVDTVRTREIAVRPGMEVLVMAQRTGGGATTEGYGVARLYRLGRG